VVAAAPPPESTVPAGRTVGAVRLDVPALAAEIVEIKMKEAPDDGDVERSAAGEG